MLQAVIFDYDGTMAPTMERQHRWFEKYWYHPVNRDRVKGKDFPYKDFKSFMKMYQEKMAPAENVQDIYDFLNLDCNMNDFNHPVWPAYKAFSTENPAILYPGMKEAIKEIWESGQLTRNYSRNRRLRLGVNTSNSWKIVFGDLEKNGVSKYFDSYVSKEILAQYHGNGNAGSIKKPSKISLALAMELLDSEGEYTIHIGDTLNDLASSNKVMRLNPAHLETLINIGVTWGYSGEGEGKEKARSVLERGVELSGDRRAYFNYVVDSPNQLVEIVKKHLKE
jgi:phosphoglycolate phosphatase-like HAD superfamily hydrolase